MRSVEDDGLKSGRTRAKYKNIQVDVMHTHTLKQEEKVLLPPHEATHVYTNAEMEKCDSKRFANNMQKPEAPQLNR